MTARLIMKLQVVAADPTTPHVLHLRLKHPLRPLLPAWTAGGHVDLRMPDGRVRQYSLCGDPADRSAYEVAIKRDDLGRGGSAWAHANLRVGATAHVSAPRNNFPLIEDAHRHILVGGGIGVTPLLAMARVLATRGADFTLHACANSRAEAPMLRELEQVCGSRLTTWFSAESRRFDPLALGDPADGTHVYTCGPARLLDAVADAAEAAGWPRAQVHSEVFQATLDENFKPEPFNVRLASSGRMLHVPAERSLLDVLRAEGITMPSSCEIGVCGSCVCGYRDGIVLHRDKVIPVGERQHRIAPCVSRARVSLTLDL